jgi:hypothetical protein
MANYVAAVPKSLQENYQIALHAGTWGVEEKWEQKIRSLRPGDLLLFLVENAFRSLHRVDAAPYVDHTPLWPDKNGDVFPNRVKISDAIAAGEVDLNHVAPSISFLKDLQRPYGAFQGGNGVLNDRMTDADMAVIREGFSTPVRRELKIDPEEARRAIHRQTIIFSLYQDDLEERVLELLPSKGLRILPGGRHVVAGSETIDALASDDRGRLVVVAINRGLAPQEMLLKILRQMSWARQNRAEGKDVRGILIAEAADRMLLDLAREVPNLSIQYYRLKLELADEPPHVNGRVA